MSESTKPTSNEAENGNKSKPLLSSRLFKFRAWITNLGVPFMAIQGTPDLETLSSFMHHYSDAKNLMQFTGIFDKNGKEIYEGDILKLKDNIGTIVCVCEYITNGFYFQSKNLGSLDPYYYTEFQIIGNIFECPELL